MLEPTPTTTAPTSAQPNGSPAPSPTALAAVGNGSLAVITSPPGAHVNIDGAMKGITPTTIPGLSAGTHVVLLKIDGFQDLSTTITIASGQTAEYTTGFAANVKTQGFDGTLALLSLVLLALALRIR